jgi:hypothetical protein
MCAFGLLPQLPAKQLGADARMQTLPDDFVTKRRVLLDRLFVPVEVAAPRALPGDEWPGSVRHGCSLDLEAMRLAFDRAHRADGLWTER